MKWFRRRPAVAAPPAERADPALIAVLEHDLLGIKPVPGSPAARAVALRRTSTCVEHRPIETTELRDPRPTAICAGCGTHMVESLAGWVVAGAEEP
ncbi:hypothetical protein OG618_36965 (plasmid) [Kitasatospora sp. NBC_01246]|uniref:hypothetical protein n=1 Tax=Kitasatospora sp. NBC_01246 TaxID=2903570 RepID=UPI002E339A55|nr:hypothetical protein [Kitasatospora sp. NBC_01246]